uniref:Uncharacterized protein n=1 Tax=Oryza punctata TaxID=4537 RepID=A0A0E0KER6_ORYPU
MIPGDLPRSEKIEPMKDHLLLDAYLEFDSNMVEVMVIARNEVGEAGRSSRKDLNDNLIRGRLRVETPLLAEGDYHFELNGEAMNLPLTIMIEPFDKVAVIKQKASCYGILVAA